MKLIDSDKFLQDMAELYRQAGWDEREVHFSLADLRSNIGMEDTILIPRRESDTVRVIRCKNCKHHKDEEPGMVFCPNIVGGWIEEDGYCFRAERKDNGTHD